MAFDSAIPALQEGIVGWATHVAANTARDGTGTVSTLLTAGADGALFVRVEALSKGTNPVSVLRLFFNNGSDPAVAANNSLQKEVKLPATVATEIAALDPVTVEFNVYVPAGYKLNSCIGTAVTDGWQVTARGRNL